MECVIGNRLCMELFVKHAHYAGQHGFTIVYCIITTSRLIKTRVFGACPTLHAPSHSGCQQAPTPSTNQVLSCPARHRAMSFLHKVSDCCTHLCVFQRETHPVPLAALRPASYKDDLISSWLLYHRPTHYFQLLFQSLTPSSSGNTERLLDTSLTQDFTDFFFTAFCLY